MDAITVEIIWSRLVSVADEVGAALARAAFSTIVNESNDFAVCILDDRGRSLVQSTVSIPVFIGTMPTTVKHILERFPAEEMGPGDLYMTNDPWKGAGHLPDITVCAPIFRNGRLIGFSASTAHAPDIGGKLWAADATEVFEEGLRLPPSQLAVAGTMQEGLLDVIRANVRQPDAVVGDLLAQVSANRLCQARLIDLLEEYDLPDLGEVGDEIMNRSEQAMRKALARIPEGTYRHVTHSDGFDEPIEYHVAVTVTGDRITVDYEGTSPQSRRGINSVFNYTYAYTAYALKCLLSPDVPNNDGSFRPIEVIAPHGSILNAVFPAAVASRSLTGHFVPFAIFGALAKALPGRVVAESGMGGHPLIATTAAETGQHRSQYFVANGGLGGRQGKDGISCYPFPSNVSNAPIEIIENRTPIVVEQKALITDSGGPGEFRGGLGQSVIVQLGARASRGIFSALSDRAQYPAKGILGGESGPLRVTIKNADQVLHPKKQEPLASLDRVEIKVPGGGGFGYAWQRDPQRVIRDVVNGLVSVEKAQSDYGVVLSADGQQVDEAQTQRLRTEMATGAERLDFAAMHRR